MISPDDLAAPGAISAAAARFAPKDTSATRIRGCFAGEAWTVRPARQARPAPPPKESRGDQEGCGCLSEAGQPHSSEDHDVVGAQVGLREVVEHDDVVVAGVDEGVRAVLRRS